MGPCFTRDDFDVFHKVGRINQDVDGHNPNPCSNKKDIKRVH
jgi:hypothetical protein